MALTQVDVDADALAAAMRLAGTHTKKETINLALRDYVARHRRMAALAQAASVADGWDYEGWLEMRKADKNPAA